MPFQRPKYFLPDYLQLSRLSTLSFVRQKQFLQSHIYLLWLKALFKKTAFKDLFQKHILCFLLLRLFSPLSPCPPYSPTFNLYIVWGPAQRCSRLILCLQAHSIVGPGSCLSCSTSDAAICLRPGKVAEDGSRSWAPIPMQETQKKLLETLGYQLQFSSSLAHLVIQGMNQWIKDHSVFPHLIKKKLPLKQK